MAQNLTDVVKALSKLKPGLLPYSIFVQVARLVVLTTVELVAFLDDKVFLLQRPSDDEFWPGMWHIPGSIVRPTDKKNNYEEALNRIVFEEFANTPFIKPPGFFRNNFRHEARGSANAIQYRALLKETPNTGKLFFIDKLPRNIVPEHVETILAAYENISHT